jgi:hypothetical protein
MTRHWQEILNELHDETHRDGYYSRANMLEQIVDELVAEMAYANVLRPTEVSYYDPSRSSQRIAYCTLPKDQAK